MIPATVAVFLLTLAGAYLWAKQDRALGPVLALVVIVIAVAAVLSSQPMPETCIWSQWC